MKQDRPTLASLFGDYEPEIRTIFARIGWESGLAGGSAPRLEFTEAGRKMLFRCVPSKRCVLADWRGIASLWAMTQGMGRLSPAMFNARRTGSARVNLTEDSPAELGYHFIGYAKQLTVPQPWRWNSFFPTPDRYTSSDAARTGEVFFSLSMEWIFRHEIGHIALGHSDSAWTAELSWAEEREADQYATRGIKSDLATHPDRALGTKPSDKELELERRALAAGIGLIWVGVHEDTRTQTNDTYPAVSNRMFRCLEEFGLAPDSAALEILSDFIKAWIDPEAAWPGRPVDETTAHAAMDEALNRLDEYARKVRA